MESSILILGANGQDGKLLCDYFDANNIFYDIVVRNSQRHNSKNIREIFIGDLNNYDFIKQIFEKNKYERVFNFANETFVRDSNLIYSSLDKTQIFFNITRIIEEKKLDFWLCQPLSSEIFGTPYEVPQNSNTEVNPINNYGLAKTIEFYASKILRSKGVKVFNPIFFNHESSYRDVRFFSAKAIQHFINYAANEDDSDVFKFHNAESVRDWGYAKEFIEIIVKASEKQINDVIVIGTGHQMSVIDFLTSIFKNLKIDVEIKKNNNNLINIIDLNTNKIIAEEMGVNKIDVGRKFRADIDELINFELEVPKIKGENLINLLIHDSKK
jgi:GDPmannose 4,6-dehydratase